MLVSLGLLLKSTSTTRDVTSRRLGKSRQFEACEYAFPNIRGKWRLKAGKFVCIVNQWFVLKISNMENCESLFAEPSSEY